MILQVEAGTERFAQWAKVKARQLDALRRDLRVYALSKFFVPEPGFLVWIKSTEAGLLVRITGGSGSVRYLSTSELTSVQAIGMRVVQYENFNAYDWSNDFKTYVRWDPAAYPAGGVHLKRKGVDLKVSNNSYPLADDAATTFYKRSAAVLSKNGKYAVAVPLSVALGGGGNQDLIAWVSRWNDDTNSFDVSALALPPTLLARISTWSSLSVVAEKNKGTMSGFTIVPFGTVGSRQVEASGSWVLHASPLGKKLHLHAKMDRVTSSGVYGSSAAPASYWKVTYTETDELWEYDIASGGWGLLHEEVPTTRSLNIEDAPASSGTALLYAEDSIKVHSTMVYDDVGAAHKVTYDNVAAPTFFIFSDPNISGAAVFRSPTTRTSSSDLLLDGAPWFHSVDVFDPNVADAFLTEISVIQVNKSRLGAIKKTNAPATMYWRWATTSDMSSTTLLAPMISKDGHWLFSPSKVYKDGALICTVTDADPTMVIRRPSFKDSGKALVSRTETAVTSPEVPPGLLYSGFGGTIHTISFGDLAVGPDNGIAFNAGGTLVYVLSGGSLISFSEADLSATFGEPVTFVLDGSVAEIHTAGSPEVSTTVTFVQMESFTTGEPKLVRDIPVTLTVGRSVADGGPIAVTYSAANIVPDDCVITV